MGNFFYLNFHLSSSGFCATVIHFTSTYVIHPILHCYYFILTTKYLLKSFSNKKIKILEYLSMQLPFGYSSFPCKDPYFHPVSFPLLPEGNSLTFLIVSVLSWFWLMDFSLSVGWIFLLLCTPGNIWLHARHCEFYLVGCCIFLYSYKYSWTLFWDTVKLLGNSFILLGLAFMICWAGSQQCLV